MDRHPNPFRQNIEIEYFPPTTTGVEPGGKTKIVGGIEYVWDSVRGKWLSNPRAYPIFSHKGAIAGINLQLNKVDSLLTGFKCLRNCTLLSIAAQSSGGNSTKTFEVRKNDTGTLVYSFSLVGGALLNPLISVDLNLGDYFYVFSISGEAVVLNPIVVLEIAWRTS